MNEIASPQNAKYRRWLSLLDSKGIKKEGLALLSGAKLVREFAGQSPEKIREILLPPKVAAELNFPSTRLTGDLFNELDTLGTHAPLAVIEAPKIPAWEPAPPRGLELVIALGDPSNLGALLRSAEAFGVSKVVLTKECASPYLPKALKAAALANFRLDLAAAGSIKEMELPEAYGLDMDGEDLADFAWPQDCRLVLGEEGPGLPSLKLKKLKIPMAGKLESLNATVAASIALYAYRAARGNRAGGRPANKSRKLPTTD